MLIFFKKDMIADLRASNEMHRLMVISLEILLS